MPSRRLFSRSRDASAVPIWSLNACGLVKRVTLIIGMPATSGERIHGVADAHPARTRDGGIDAGAGIVLHGDGVQDRRVHRQVALRQRRHHAAYAVLADGDLGLADAEAPLQPPLLEESAGLAGVDH